MQIKNKKRFLVAGILGILFVFLHIFVYLFAKMPYLTNFVPQPFYWNKIELKEVIHPSYLNPFLKVEYRYTEKQKNDVILIEKTEAIFSNDIVWDICKFGRDILKIQKADICMKKNIRADKSEILKISFGNPEKYYDPDVDGMFMRGFAGEYYANWLFFIIQYLILISFFYNLFGAFYFKEK